MQPGDIIGTWLFEDLQQTLLLMKWVSFGPLGHDSYHCNFGFGSSDVSLEAARADAQAHWATGGYCDWPYFMTVVDKQGPWWSVNVSSGWEKLGVDGLPTIEAGSVKAEVYGKCREEWGTTPAEFFCPVGYTQSDPVDSLQLLAPDEEYDGSGLFFIILGSDDFPSAWPPGTPGTMYDYFVSWCYVVIHMNDVFDWK